MKTDVNGCSTCPVGAEQYEEYTQSWDGECRVQYDYRHTDGKLFSTIAISLDIARARRDRWLAERAPQTGGAS